MNLLFKKHRHFVMHSQRQPCHTMNKLVKSAVYLHKNEVTTIKILVWKTKILAWNHARRLPWKMFVCDVGGFSSTVCTDTRNHGVLGTKACLLCQSSASLPQQSFKRGPDMNAFATYCVSGTTHFRTSDGSWSPTSIESLRGGYELPWCSKIESNHCDDVISPV